MTTISSPCIFVSGGDPFFVILAGNPVTWCGFAVQINHCYYKVDNDKAFEPI